MRRKNVLTFLGVPFRQELLPAAPDAGVEPWKPGRICSHGRHRHKFSKEMQMTAKVESTMGAERKRSPAVSAGRGFLLLTLGKEVSFAERRALVRSHLKTQQIVTDQFVRQIGDRKWFSFNSIEWSRVGKEVGEGDVRIPWR
jgi:hypothetical protein